MRRMCLMGGCVALIAAAVLLSQPVNESKPIAESAGMRAFGPVHPRLSPDGTKIAFSYQGAIWIMPADGGPMKRLTSGEGLDVEPAWSPDGKTIAFVNSRNFSAGPLRIVNVESGQVSAPSSAPVASGKLAIHTDNTRILGSFQSPRGETLAWYDLTSGKITSVTDPPRPARKASLSADGKWIAFATHQDVPGTQQGNDGPQADLWKVPADGGKPEKITQWASRIHDVCWTANGKELIVTSDLGSAYYDLWQIPLDNPQAGARKLTHGQADEDRPSTSADGRWLVYTDNHEGCTALVRRDLRGGDEHSVPMTGLDFGKATGMVKLKFVDKATGKPVAARVSLLDAGAKLYAPPGAIYRVERGNGHFYCRDSADFKLPAGEYQLRAWRGTEYSVARQSVRIADGKTTEVRVELERWVDAASFNLYSGENHIHANYGYGAWYNTPETMLLHCEGEDLNVCNFMVANSDTDGVFDRAFFRGRPDPLSTPRTILYWNEEYRSTIWGHMTLLNLKQLIEPIFTGFKDTTNPFDVPTNADSAGRTRDRGGFASYTHAAQNPADPYLNPYTGKGLPIDAALGKIDSMDLNNSYAGSVVLWHRLLNCGFKLPASAGTDCFLNHLAGRLPGCDRCYVRIDGELTYEKWIEGLRAGRSFVTNGPMAELIVDGKLRQGDTLRLAGPGKVKVVAKVWYNLPLKKIEIIQNGVVAATRDVAGKAKPEEVWELEVPVERSGWIAVRASGGPHADNPAGDAFAHTSPVYVDVAGKPIDARADAEFFLKWIDRLDVALRERARFPTPADRAHVAEQLEAARAVYRKLGGR